MEDLKNYITRNLVIKNKLVSKRLSVLPEQIKQQILQQTEKCDGTIGERIYWILNDLSDYPKCQFCGSSITKNFSGIQKGYITNYCSIKCAKRDPKNKEKTKQTNLQKYGVENPNQSNAVREKTKQTNLQKYGVENPAQNSEIQSKICSSMEEKYGKRRVLATKAGREQFEQKMEEKYGTRNANYNKELIEKRKAIMLERHGVENALQMQEAKEKGMEKKYGVKSTMHVPKIVEKCHKHRTKSVVVEGRVITFMGYENVALFELLKVYKINELKWKKSDMPEIRYDFDGKKRRYYPDIWIPQINTIIEVKSEWTWNKDLEKNEEKLKAAENSGLNVEVWICNKTSVIKIIKGTEVPFICFP